MLHDIASVREWLGDFSVGSRRVKDPGWPTGTLEERVRHAIEEVRPAVQLDGGDLELRLIEDGVVHVVLRGACDGCPMAHSTLSDFVAERIKLYAPEITDVVAD
jgi:Fe-S cluster biogenesis protein NfuA